MLQDGWYPLLYAVRGGHVAVVKCLLEKEKEFAEHAGSVRSTNKVYAKVLRQTSTAISLDIFKEKTPHPM